MRITKPLLVSLAACTTLAHGDVNGADALWTDNFNVLKPITDNGGAALAIRDVVQIGFFEGVDPAKNPDEYTANDWASFRALTGDASQNPTAFPNSIIGAGGAPEGFFTFGVGFDTEVHSGIPTEVVRLGLRFYDADTVAGATNYNTVSSSDADWLLPVPIPPPPTSPNQAFANMDASDVAGTLAWEGAPFKTDLVPGVVAPDLVLTSVTQTGPATLEISWTGGDGSNDIETSTNGTTWTPGPTGVSSPATIAINPAANPKLLVRVVEP